VVPRLSRLLIWNTTKHKPTPTSQASLSHQAWEKSAFWLQEYNLAFLRQTGTGTSTTKNDILYQCATKHFYERKKNDMMPYEYINITCYFLSPKDKINRALCVHVSHNVFACVSHSVYIFSFRNSRAHYSLVTSASTMFICSNQTHDITLYTYIYKYLPLPWTSNICHSILLYNSLRLSR